MNGSTYFELINGVCLYHTFTLSSYRKSRHNLYSVSFNNIYLLEDSKKTGYLLPCKFDGQTAMDCKKKYIYS